MVRLFCHLRQFVLSCHVTGKPVSFRNSLFLQSLQETGPQQRFFLSSRPAGREGSPAELGRDMPAKKITIGITTL